ncbi:MAG: hypothetical protein ACLQGP_33855 [Isosphaeraceae bacterium]
MTTERLYYPEVECEATPSDLYDTEVVGVLDETENRHSLRVASGVVQRIEGKAYLPILVVDLDRRKGRVLIQLPYEADSGANRLWVPLDRFRSEMKAGEYVA